MALLKILKFPHPLLREKCPEVTRFDAALQQLISDMVETMYHCPGAVGLAGCQVGVLQRLFVVDVSAKTTRDQLKVVINPELIQTSRNKLSREGCLSFPEYLANVKRATRVTLRCFDALGQTQEYQVRDLEAVAIQHEIDHLDGILMIDRIDAVKTDLIRRHHYPQAEAEPETPIGFESI